MRALLGHTRDVRAVAYTPDGRLVSGGGADKTGRLWNVLTGECTATIKAKGPVYAVAASPDGKTFAYAGRHASGADSNFAFVCDLTGKPIAKYELRTREDRLVQVPGTFEFRTVPTWVPRSIWSLAFSADGQYLAAACRRIGSGGDLDGGGGRAWHLARKPEVHLDDDANAVAFAPAGKRLAVTRGGAVEFREVLAFGLPVRYPLTCEWSPSVAFVPGADVAVVAASSFLYFANPVKFEKPTRLKTGLRIVVAVAASPDGKTVLVGGKPGMIEVYDMATRKRTTTYDFGIGPVHALAYAPDGLTFAAAGETGLVVCDAAG
jgi:WD40 repeat protein